MYVFRWNYDNKLNAFLNDSNLCLIIVCKHLISIMQKYLNIIFIIPYTYTKLPVRFVLRIMH